MSNLYEKPEGFAANLLRSAAVGMAATSETKYGDPSEPQAGSLSLLTDTVKGLPLGKPRAEWIEVDDGDPHFR